MVNAEHLRLCASQEWAQTVVGSLLPWVLDGVDLGAHLLEVGPGPGRTTEALRARVPRLTAAEADPVLAAALSGRWAGVHAVTADACALPFAAAAFSSAACLTMLHHVPSVTAQDRLLTELVRVLAPGGVLVGVDSLDRASFRALHKGDVCVPVDPAGLAGRLHTAGFGAAEVEVREHRVRFRAVIPDD